MSQKQANPLANPLLKLELELRGRFRLPKLKGIELHVNCNDRPDMLIDDLGLRDVVAI
jgi:hypothetical protein